MAETDSSAEIEAALHAALSRMGVAAPVSVRGSTAELHGRGSVVAIDLGDWAGQWPLLPPDIRARKVRAAATRLLAAAEGSRPAAMRAGGRGWRRGGSGWLAVAVAIGLVVAAIYWLRQSNFFGSASEHSLSRRGASSEPHASAAPRLPEEPGRAARVCDATRTRLRAGGTMAGLDVEGWEVGLWLARRAYDPAWSRAVRAEVSDGRLAERVRQALGLAQPAELRLVLPQGSATTRNARGSVSVRFGGDCTRAFFEADGRSRIVRFAAQWAVEAGAELAALYGTCAHLDSPELGAWYWGRDDAAAVGALLYGSWLGGQPPLGARSGLTAVDDPLAELVARAARLGWPRAAAVIAEQGGSVARAPAGSGSRRDAGAEPPHGTSIRFPLGGPTRARRAGRLLLVEAFETDAGR